MRRSTSLAAVVSADWVEVSLTVRSARLRQRSLAPPRAPVTEAAAVDPVRGGFRIIVITGSFSIAAMIFSSPPPQFVHRSVSMANTRLSNRAQLMRCGRA